MYGTYFGEWAPENDHHAIVYPLSFIPADEYTTEATEALRGVIETGETGCPWDNNPENIIRQLINEICGFRLQDRCNRLKAAYRESY